MITCIFWLSTFSLLVWECMSGDATFAIFRESGVSDIVAYVTASKVKAAIIGLKVAIGLSCINWMVFVVTFFFASMCCSSGCFGNHFLSRFRYLYRTC